MLVGEVKVGLDVGRLEGALVGLEVEGAAVGALLIQTVNV